MMTVEKSKFLTYPLAKEISSSFKTPIYVYGIELFVCIFIGSF